MEIITKIFEFDFAALVPDLPSLLEKVCTIVRLAIFVGPILLLVQGLFYLVFPPKEANHRMGFRTYFGMGSVEAWRYTQRMAGLIYGFLGGVLLLVALIVSLATIGKDPNRLVTIVSTCLLWQAIPVLLARLSVGILAAVHFDRDGYRRRR